MEEINKLMVSDFSTREFFRITIYHTFPSPAYGKYKREEPLSGLRLLGECLQQFVPRLEPPYLFLEVEKNPDALQHGRLVVLRIRKENLISHE